MPRALSVTRPSLGSSFKCNTHSPEGVNDFETVGFLRSGLGWLGFLGRVDPDGSRDLGWFGTLADEALGRAEKRGVKCGLAGGMDCARLPEVDLVGCHQADACVMVLVIPGCEPAAECAGLNDGLEPFWELRLVFQRLEMGLREGVVV